MRKSELPSYQFQQFYGTYLAALGDVELHSALKEGMEKFIRFLDSIPEADLYKTYAQGKWTVAQVLGHIIDTERIFQYRALRFSRNDGTPLPGFDQNAYVTALLYEGRSIASFVEEFVAVRKSSIALFSNLSETQLAYSGTASNIQWTVAGLGFVISGHQEHHLRLLQERYLRA